MQTLNLTSLVRGRISSYVWRVIWITAFVALALYLHHIGGSLKESITNGTIESYDAEAPILFSAVGVWLSGIIAAFIALNLVFAELEDVVFESGADGYWHTITRSSRNLFGSTSVVTIVIDEITQVELCQTKEERKHNIGTISITLLKYHGTRTESTTLSFLSVENPETARKTILAHLPPSKGLSMAVNVEKVAAEK